MISSKKEEETIIKWLLAETINYQNKKNLWFTSDWLTRTGTHKTLFNIFEQFNIPVTRSWYLYGGFIHSDILIGKRFSSFKHDYTKHPKRISGLRKRARSLFLPMGEIQESLGEYADEIFSQSVDSYLRTFYDDALEYIRPIYKAKHELGSWNGLLDRFKFLDITEYEDIKTNIEKIYEMISEFHLSALRLYNDDILEKMNLQFSHLLEESLRKLDLLIRRKKKISKTKLVSLAKAREIFDNYVWKAYACQISYDTLIGLRSKHEKELAIRRKRRTIKNSSRAFKEYSSDLKKRDLKLTLRDIEILHEYEIEENDFKKSISTMINIYKRSTEEN